MVTVLCGGVRFQQIEAILFDKDGTLANSENFLKAIGQKRARLIDAQIPGVQEPLLMAFGFVNDRLNPAGLLAVGTRRECEIAAAAYVAETGRDWIESLTLVQSAFEEADKVFQRKADSTPLIQGGFELLQTLHAAGLKLGILSSDITDNVRDFAQRYQIDPFMQLYLGADGIVHKPDPRLLLQACQTLDVLPESVLVVGDSSADIEMARSAKAAGSIAVTWGWDTPTRLANASAIIHRWEEIQIVL